MGLDRNQDGSLSWREFLRTVPDPREFKDVNNRLWWYWNAFGNRKKNKCHSDAGGLKSDNSNVEVKEVTFMNNSDMEVELFWIDYDGHRSSYGKIPP